MLLQIYAGSAKVGWAEVAVEIICFMLNIHNRICGIQAKVSSSEINPINIIIIVTSEFVCTNQAAILLDVFSGSGFFTKGQKMGSFCIVETTTFIIRQSQLCIIQVP